MQSTKLKATVSLTAHAVSLIRRNEDEAPIEKPCAMTRAVMSRLVSLIEDLPAESRLARVDMANEHYVEMLTFVAWGKRLGMVSACDFRR